MLLKLVYHVTGYCATNGSVMARALSIKREFLKVSHLKSKTKNERVESQSRLEDNF